MMAESYGTPPDELLGADLSPAESFWFNTDVWTARRIFAKRVQNASGDQTTSGSGLQSMGAVSEQQDMASSQQQRAAQREEMDAAGRMAPDVEEQLQRMEQIQAEQAAGDH